MKRFTLRRLVVGAAGFVSTLIVALLVLPLLIDINAYKPEIVAEVKRETGRELSIDGPISLSLLPFPTVRLEGVRFADLVQAKSIAVQPSLLALLTGRLEASAVNVVEPRVALQVDANGQPNWMPAPSAGDSGSLPAKSVSIENGTLTFNDARTGLSVSASKMNLTALAETMGGPFVVVGRASLDDSPMKLDLSLGAKQPTGYDVSVALEVAGGELTYKGTLSELGPGAVLSGHASASADNLVLFVETLARIAGQPQPHLPPLLAGAFRYDGPVELSRTAFA
ncbi:MAG: AsmA family protein, partial [Solimonas sp.]